MSYGQQRVNSQYGSSLGSQQPKRSKHKGPVRTITREVRRQVVRHVRRKVLGF